MILCGPAWYKSPERIMRSFPIFLALLLVGCGEENTTPVASPELLETGADLVSIGLQENITSEGIREATIQADTAFYYQDSTVYHLRNLTLVVYNETGAERARVTAERGRMRIDTDELVARGDVVLTIEGQSGRQTGGAGQQEAAIPRRRIETEELNYDPNGDRIWSDSSTVMYEAGTVIRGKSFESDLDFRRPEVLDGSIINTGDTTPLPPADSGGGGQEGSSGPDPAPGPEGPGS